MGTVPQWIAAGVAVVGVLVTIFLNSNASKRMEGSFAARLDGHATDIGDIKDEQVRQWETLGRHGERITAVESRRTR